MQRNDTIPAGLCQCGCGQRTAQFTYTSKTQGFVKGDYKRYVHGHNSRGVRLIQEPFFTVDEASGCWNWNYSKTSAGYGHLQSGDRVILAHRWVYTERVGEIPDGMVLDHICRNPGCVNPDHLEPVTHQENVRRGNAKKFSDEVLADAIHRRLQGQSIRLIAQETGISAPYLWRLCRGMRLNPRHH